MPKRIDLFGTVNEKTPKARVNGAPTITKAMKTFHDLHVARHGFPPLIAHGKDSKLMKMLVDTWGEDEVISLIHEFFSTLDPKVVRSDYNIGALYYLAQHLRVRRGEPEPDHRTMKNLDALARATGRR